MAGEIRDLEDQLYEYDYQYQLLEQERDSLRQQNQQLMARPPVAAPKKSLTSPQPLQFEPRRSPSLKSAEPMLQPEELPLQPESILERKSVPDDELPSPTPPKSPARTPSGSAGSSPQVPSFPGTGAQTGTATEPKLPNNESLPSPSQPRPSQPSPSFEDIDPEDIAPPPIDFGTPMPPPFPAVTQNADGESIAPENSLEMNLSRIEVPGMLASTSSAPQASIQIAKEKVTDTRVVELAFHPTLSRAINLDDRPDDDGIYIVLQPMNERGQMVPVVADLTIFVLDPSREADKSQIGRWEYAAEDVQAKLQPIGSEQGIHFRLPWNGPDPGADRVIVFALYKFENGRQVMGQKDIFVSSDGSHKTVWTPRSSPKADSPIATAGFQTEPSSAARQASAQPKNVVRPASGAANTEAAPAPHW